MAWEAVDGARFYAVYRLPADAAAAGLWQQSVNERVVAERFQALLANVAGQVQGRMALYEYGRIGARLVHSGALHADC